MLSQDAQRTDMFRKNALLNELYDNIERCSIEELELLQHLANSLNKTRESGFHFLGHSLGIELAVENEAVMHLGLHNENRYGNAQGGAIYTLADVTIAKQIIDKLPDDKNVYTLEMKMNYFKPGHGKQLHAKSSILHWGRKTVVGECDILDEGEELVAKAIGTFYVARKRV
ncbi:PaaI family thioesterase [Schinkia azotoformans]|uniref:PaaI family thioesterase n=1 Tax=Schinkia azotoformans TaxID=1454 RepID=UPI002E24A03F|nr:PaaI family thioesterase [Schinkia azotoformans]